MTDPSRYDQLSPLARALVDDYDALDLAEMLVKAQDELAAHRAAYALDAPLHDQLQAAIKALGTSETLLARARALHQPQPDGSGFPDGQQCRTCSQDGGDGYQYLVPYPCPTIQALDQPAPAATEATEPQEQP